MQESKNRNIGLDLLRIFACFLVILYHIPQYVSGNIEFHDVISRALNSSFFYIGRTAVPLFFIMSGYFLLPLKTEVNSFFKKRFSRIIIPTIIWFILYQLIGASYENPIKSFWIDKTPHFWYLYALIGIYLLVPIISPWFKESNNRQKLFYLLLWMATLTFVIFDRSPISIVFTHQGLLYYSPFHALISFSGYLGYFVLGALFRNNGEIVKRHAFFICVACILIYSILIFVIKMLFATSDSNLIAYCSVPTALLSLSIFILFIKIGENLAFEKTTWGEDIVNPARLSPNTHLYACLNDVSKATFSMYLMHPLILSYVQIDSIGGYSRLFISIAVFIVTYLIYKILSFIPFSKYILG